MQGEEEEEEGERTRGEYYSFKPFKPLQKKSLLYHTIKDSFIMVMHLWWSDGW